MGNQVEFMNIALILLTILGSLSMFLYGMKTTGEALQRLGGDHLKDFVASIAPNKVKGLFSGFWITGAVQSSTAVTVMLVSFVNAGIFTLEQSLSILIGANVGTTITTWIIALIGFNPDFNLILLPILAFTLPLMFNKNKTFRFVAKLITGLVLIFTGFYFLNSSVSSIDNYPQILEAISSYSNNFFTTNLLYVVAGIVITIILRSSSAMVALTMVMCVHGWMSFENAIAMIIGENIGTTLTANIAARIANKQAKRIALGHTLFNVTGALIILIFFNSIVSVITGFTETVFGQFPTSNSAVVPFGLAVFHTLFNVITMVLFMPLLKWFKLILELIIPVKPNEGKKSSLKYIDHGYLSMSEMSIIQVQKEILHYGEHVAIMFSLVSRYLLEKREDKFLKIQKKLNKLEDLADDKEVAISNYLTKVTVSGLTEVGSRKVRSMLKMIDDIESIADQCMLLEKTIRLKNEANAWLTPELREDILSLFELIKDSIDNMNYNLANDYRPGILVKANEIELRINNARGRFIEFNNKNVEEGKYSYQNGALFSDLANICEKIGDHVINVNQAIASNVKS